ncbi:MAG: response regulator [Sphingomonadaceae bacterium]
MRRCTNITDFLASARIRIDVAVHGGEALRMVQEADYDLVLMDIQMQEVDGLTAARRIRTIERLQHLPIIAMTARAMPSDRDKSLAAGMDDHVTKPVDPELLFRTLLKWIPAQRLARRALATAVAKPLTEGQPGQPAPLPAVAGIDWQVALENVDQQRAKLERRVHNFLLEYRSAPGAIRDALAVADMARLQHLAHNLRPSAAYLGAAAVSTLATQVEQDVRAGRQPGSAAELASALDRVLAGLAQLGRTAVALHTHGAEVGQLLDQLEACLRQDDARAEDLLAALQERLSGSGYTITLAAIQQAVDDIEYAAALAPLATLAAALHLNLEECA